MSRFVQKREGDEVWDACHLASQMGVRVPSLWGWGGGGGKTRTPHLTSPPLSLFFFSLILANLLTYLATY